MSLGAVGTLTFPFLHAMIGPMMGLILAFWLCAALPEGEGYVRRGSGETNW